MNMLAFDTSFGACSAALFWSDHSELPPPSADAYRVSTRFERMERGHAERLIPMIAEVIAESPLGFENIDRIFVPNGPGTFTGVRIAVAAARALALSTGATVATASSLQLMAAEIAALAARDDESDIAIAVDARRDEIYFQLFAETQLPLTGPLLVSADHAASLLRDRPTVVAGSGAELFCAAAAARGRNLKPRFPDLEPDAGYSLGVPYKLCDGPLRPLYLRPPDAKPGTAPPIARAS